MHLHYAVPTFICKTYSQVNLCYAYRLEPVDVKSNYIVSENSICDTHSHWKFWLGVTDAKLGSHWDGEVAQKVNLLYWMNSVCH